ncbi:MAG: hypothetical protein Q9202_007324 [Teloschistes flavicans]
MASQAFIYTKYQEQQLTIDENKEQLVKDWQERHDEARALVSVNRWNSVEDVRLRAPHNPITFYSDAMMILNKKEYLSPFVKELQRHDIETTIRNIDEISDWTKLTLLSAPPLLHWKLLVIMAEIQYKPANDLGIYRLVLRLYREAAGPIRNLQSMIKKRAAHPELMAIVVKFISSMELMLAGYIQGYERSRSLICLCENCLTMAQLDSLDTGHCDDVRDRWLARIKHQLFKLKYKVEQGTGNQST